VSPAETRPPEVSRVLHRAAATIRAHRMLEPGDSVLASVSGGPDSLCLLHSLHRLERLLRIRVTCFHFDHRLRDGSKRDAAYVRGQAGRLGLPFVLAVATSRPARGESVEAWGRSVRYAALRRAMAETGAAAAATGHTLDDQAETILMAALRGGGLEALSGIAPISGGVVRPLLEVRRAEVEAFCRALHLRPRRDPMNRDASFLRVAVRRRALPLLERAVDRNAAGALARTAGLLRADAELLNELAAEATSDVLVHARDGVSLRTTALCRLPDPLASRVVRLAVVAAGTLPESAHVEAVLDLARGRPGRRVSLPGGLLARRDRGYVRLSPSAGRTA
jgi:tRNA(Ile)-lysidine synthase